MKHLLILLSILLLSSPVIGQSKPLGVVLPPTVMGNVSNSRKQILLNTLDEEISRYFDVSPPTNVSSGDLPVVSDVFQLQIVEEDGDTQLSVRWMSGNERKIETILCGGCKTIELNGKLEELVGKFFDGKKVVKKRQKGVLYFVNRNGKIGWYKDGYENTDWKYVGEIKNGKPNGQGTYTSTDGRKYVGMFKDGKYHGQGIWTYSSVGQKDEGEWKDGKMTGQGTSTYPNGDKYVGEYKDGKKWNGIRYYKDGNIKYKIVYGEWIRQ
jgi:hypothetical protein